MTPSPNPVDQGTSPNSLADELAEVLPKDVTFVAHHLSTPPTLTEPLCYPPAYPQTAQDNGTVTQSDVRARKPLKTYCEKHFLAVSVHTPDTKQQVLALAVEIYLYTTAHSTILFIAKADSTGYLSLVSLPRGTPSPIREITATFISHLIAHRRRKGKQFIVNLFARAQSQYLFPGSVKNSGKHILDDRGLVKWWCRVLNPLLESGHDTKKWANIHGFLVIPGLDDYETRAFLPRTSAAPKNWTLGHPLERISPYISDPTTYGGSIPARCLIPTYPDDPKARFVVELEESTAERTKLLTGWKSPRSLEQFWEMMAFRQECSSGRLTGFIWLVFDTASKSSTRTGTTDRNTEVSNSTANEYSAGPPGSTTFSRLLTPEPSQGLEAFITPSSTQSTPGKPRAKRPKKKVLRGRIVPREPRIKTHQRAHLPKETDTAYYHWPEEGRGQVIFDEPGYKRANELLLHLEFGTLEQAIASSGRWIKEVNVGEDWSFEILGKRELPAAAASGVTGGAVNDLSSMVKKKLPATDANAVNTLDTSLVRKRAKLSADTPASATDEPTINTLGAGLARKKPKPA
jgi:regulator of Ty1 transposition protein 109